MPLSEPVPVYGNVRPNPGPPGTGSDPRPTRPIGIEPSPAPPPASGPPNPFQVLNPYRDQPSDFVVGPQPPALVAGLVDDEWARFLQGIKNLDPAYADRYQYLVNGGPRPPGAPTQVNVPGWNQIIKTGPGVEIPQGGWAAYYKAQRTGQASTNSPEVDKAIRERIVMRENIRKSAQPAWAANWGNIMTAIDNVQDMLSTLATLGRLLLWAAPKAGSRLIPVVGWIITAADILNMMNLLGLVAMPLYGFLCKGPRDAIAAGIPGLVLKNVLCQETWTTVFHNPFSKAGRAAAQLRALGRLPSISNLIEVLQTTDNLWGYGLSIGALYGTMMDINFTLADAAKVPALEGRGPVVDGARNRSMVDRVQAAPPGQREAWGQAARVVAGAPFIAAHADLFPDAFHLAHMVALLGAVPMVYDFYKPLEHEAIMQEALPQLWPAPTQRPRDWRYVLDGCTPREAGIGTWPLEGNPERATGAQLVEQLGPQVTTAVTTFLEPRRNRPDMTFYGSAVNQVTENLWYMIGGGPDALRFKLTPDYQLLTTMSVEGLLVRQGEPEGRLWKFWQSARALVAARGDRMLERADVVGLANAAGITLLRILPTDAEWPAAWGPFFADPNKYTGVDVGSDPAGFT